MYDVSRDSTIVRKHVRAGRLFFPKKSPQQNNGGQSCRHQKIRRAAVKVSFEGYATMSVRFNFPPTLP